VVLLIIIGVIHARRWLRLGTTTAERATGRIIVTLIAFTLLFCANTAVGRVFFGIVSAQTSRYIPYLIPAIFAIFLHVMSLGAGVRKNIILGAIVACLIAATFPMRESDRRCVKWFVKGKTKWKACYLETGDIDAAGKAAASSAPGFMIHPVPEVTQLKRKLEYLREHNLNLYLDAPTR
jgi:hypothetical protein